MQYLYYRKHYSDRKVYRSQVTRETESNYWIKSGQSETRISKKTMSVGETWSKTYYKEETPELLEEYKNSVLEIKFKNKLEELSKCTDKNTMIEVLKIKIGKVGE